MLVTGVCYAGIFDLQKVAVSEEVVAEHNRNT